MNSFTDFLNPISKQDFLEQYYEKQFFLLERNNIHFYETILNVNDIDKYLSNHDIEYPSVRLVKNGKELDGDLYLKNINYGTAMFEGLVDTDKMFQLYCLGSTIIIQGLDRSNKALGDFCRKLSVELPFTFQSNIYITPNDSKGFESHYDTHDVFVMQIKGKKRWQLFEPNPVTLPTKMEKFDSKRTNISNLKLLKEFDLNVGDLLYIPRGMIHNARSLSEDSIHITLGVFPEKWFDLFRYVANESYQIDEMKYTLPIHSKTSRFDTEIIKRELKKYFDLLLEGDYLDKVLNQFAQDNLRKRKSDDQGRLCDLINLENIKYSTEFILRSNIVYDYYKNNIHCEIRFYSKIIKFPLPVDNTLITILSGKVFSCESLDQILSLESRLVVVKKLLKEGFIKTYDK